MIELRGVHKSFGPKAILDGVDLETKKGEIHFVIGTSGAGKSVLLKHIVGLLRPDQGHVFVDGVDVTRFAEKQFYPIRKKCALVLQHATLFDSMTCEENVSLPLLKHTKLSRTQARERALALLDEVRMLAFADAHPVRLGDGMRKSVAVARALALEPEYMLFDEPTTSLDPLSARRVDSLIAELAEKRGVGCIVVSHDLPSIFGIAHQVTMLYKGRVLARGTPQALLGSTDQVVLQFIHGLPEGPLETT